MLDMVPYGQHSVAYLPKAGILKSAQTAVDIERLWKQDRC
jgi:hypothetical protein